jgi:hypothetical protein
MWVKFECFRNATNNIAWLSIATVLMGSLAMISCDSDAGASTCSPANAYQGSYSGTWGTATSQYGTWNAVIDTCGGVSGSGLQSGSAAFTISGTSDSSGNVTFGATQQNGTITATFSGTVATDGSIQGTWTSVDGSASGTFSGSRE